MGADQRDRESLIGIPAGPDTEASADAARFDEGIMNEPSEVEASVKRKRASGEVQWQSETAKQPSAKSRQCRRRTACISNQRLPTPAMLVVKPAEPLHHFGCSFPFHAVVIHRRLIAAFLAREVLEHRRGLHPGERRRFLHQAAKNRAIDRGSSESGLPALFAVCDAPPAIRA